MNVDPSKAVGNGTVGTSSNSSTKQYVANGGYPDRSYNYLNNDFSFPPGGIPSLHLPVVVVLSSIDCLPCYGYFFRGHLKLLYMSKTCKTHAKFEPVVIKAKGK